MKYIIITAKLLFLGLFLTTSFIACDDESVKYQMTGGVPEVYYVRLSDPLLADSLIVSAYMEQPICLIGNNLTSIQEIFFNDQKATLNINYITDNTLLVTIPKNIPEDVTNKIYMVTGKKDTVAYDFKVLVPAPVLSRMKCEYAQVGTEDAIFGDYLLDDPNVPIEVVFSGNVKAQILSSNKNEVRFIVPDGALEGPVTVTTQYGTSRSTFHYLESRGLITSFEASENGGTGYVPGWGRPDPSQIIEDEYSITGKYVRMAGSISPADDKDGWASGGNNFTINIWSCDNDQNPNSGIPNPMITGDLSTLILKCEVNVLETWSASPMIFAFAAATDNEGWLWADGTQPRAFWAPWTSTGSYVSDGWETVSIPLSTMKFNGSGEDVGLPTGLGQLGISVHNRGGSSYIGTPCSPVILIDNIRVVSIE